MFINFFLDLRKAKVPCTLREYLTLVEAVSKGLGDYDLDTFYYLARASLVKDERHIDRFDKVFAHTFKGIGDIPMGEGDAPAPLELPEEWLRKMAENLLSDEEKELIESLGGFEELMKTLQKRLEEQEKRHQGGSKWIGTAGTSPFGAYGYNPEGVRIGQDKSRHRKAVKVWDKREFKNFDDEVEIGTRNIKVALKRLRNWAREGAEDELDLDETIRGTAENAGYLDIHMRPERHNKIKVLLFLDVGGSMDDHIRVVEELFSAASTEFKHMEYYYFHNCPYEGVWKDNRRRHEKRIPTQDVMRTYGKDYKAIFVGDATMSPYEIMYPGGSVEHWNEVAGKVWLEEMLNTWKKAIWINPVQERYWGYTPSLKLVREIMDNRMYPLTLEGITDGMRELSR